MERSPKRGKSRKSDNIIPNIRRHIGLYSPDSTPVVIREAARVYAPPKDMVRQMRRRLRQWEHDPPQDQAEFELRASLRPVNYTSMPPAEQWAIDKRLGILDWPSK